MTALVADPPQQQNDDPKRAVLAGIVLVLLSDQDSDGMAADILPLLALLGIPASAGLSALRLALPHHSVPSRGPGPATAWLRGAEVVHRAQYLSAAAERLKAAPDATDKERRYLEQHLAAVRARRAAVTEVDRVSRRHGAVLGWRAVLDSRTTPECRAAHGHNFSASTPPVIGWPGTLHGGTCRCRPAAPFKQSIGVDQAVSNMLERERPEVVPFGVELARAQ